MCLLSSNVQHELPRILSLDYLINQGVKLVALTWKIIHKTYQHSL